MRRSIALPLELSICLWMDRVLQKKITLGSAERIPGREAWQEGRVAVPTQGRSAGVISLFLPWSGGSEFKGKDWEEHSAMGWKRILFFLW